MQSARFKAARHLGKRVRVFVTPATHPYHIDGVLRAFDAHMTLVLTEAIETRTVRRKRVQPDAEAVENTEKKAKSNVEFDEEQRSLGLVILRGAEVLSIGEVPQDKASADRGRKRGRAANLPIVAEETKTSLFTE